MFWHSFAVCDPWEYLLRRASASVLYRDALAFQSIFCYSAHHETEAVSAFYCCSALTTTVWTHSTWADVLQRSRVNYSADSTKTTAPKWWKILKGLAVIAATSGHKNPVNICKYTLSSKISLPTCWNRATSLPWKRNSAAFYRTCLIVVELLFLYNQSRWGFCDPVRTRKHRDNSKSIAKGKWIFIICAWWRIT